MAARPHVVPAVVTPVAAAIFAGCVAAGALRAQTIRVGENVRVARGLEARPLVEPHVAAHPGDANHLLGAVIVSVAAAGDLSAAFPEAQSCSTVLSLDGGRTWTRQDFAIRHCADPWVAITPSGRAVFAALGAHASLPRQGAGGVVVFHSADGGRTWGERPVGLGPGQDHPTIAVDASSPARAGWLYVVATDAIRGDGGKLRFSVLVARSRDGGRTFDEPAKVVPSNLNLNAELPAVLSDGTLVVSFLDSQRRGVDGWADAVDLDRRRAWMLRSTDGGRTFSVPLLASEVCAFGWTALAADTAAGPFRDRLYHACKRKADGAIVVAHSPDGGETWAEPVPAHAAVADTGRAAGLRASPALAVNKRGVLAVAWVGGRREPGADGWCATLYFSASLDGGRTFSPERRMSDARSCPGRAANGSASDRWPYGGDYFGIAAAPDGRFHLLWADARGGGPFQLWTAAVDVEGGARAPQR